MKKVFLICLACVSLVSMAQEKKVVWDYPIKPETKEWKDCNSPEEIYKALMVPEKVLKNMDTESLIQICLDYPAPTIFYIFNTPQQGFDGFYKQFNGIQELMSRKDAATFLLKKYTNMSLDGFNSLWPLERQGKFVDKFYYIELFLSQSVIMQSLSKSERKLLMEESLKKYDLKNSREDLFGGHNRSATIWVMARILFNEKKLDITKTSKFPETVVSSLESGLLLDFDVKLIHQQAKSYSYE
jgi:hypothetical protein